MHKFQTNFFIDHLLTHASQRTGLASQTIIRLANTVSYIGQISYGDSINKIIAEDISNIKKLVNLLNIDEEQDEESVEMFDEGNISQHTYKDMITQNHPNELSGVNDYSLLSVPTGSQ